MQYSSDWLTYVVGRMLVKCRFMTLPNLFVDREVLPEFFIVGSPAKSILRITEVLHGWLSVQDRLDAARQEVEQLRSEFAQTGATRRAADYLLQRLAPAETVPPAAKAA